MVATLAAGAGGPTPTVQPSRVLPLLVVYALAAVAVTGWVLWFFGPRSPTTPTRARRTSSVIGLVVVAALLLALFGLSGLLGHLGTDETSDGGEGPATTEDLGSGSEDDTAGVEERDRTAAWRALGGLVLALGIAGIAARRLLGSPRDGGTGRGETTTEPDDPPTLRRGLDRALDLLTETADPRRAIIVAYAECEAAGRSAGLPSDPAATPFEQLRRLDARLSTSRDAARRLTALFERAVFSPHPVGRNEQDEAREALRAIRDDLARDPTVEVDR